MAADSFLIPDPQSIHFSVSHYRSSEYEIHYHTFYELYYFVGGDADYLVEGTEYRLTPHSLLLLSPYAFHGVRVNSDAPYVRCVIQFAPEALSAERRAFLLSSFPGSKKNSPKEVFYEHTEQFGLYDCLDRLIQSQKQPTALREQYYPIYLEALLAQVSLMCQTLSPTQVSSSAPEAITDILSYLNDHLTDPITLDGLSRRFYISKYYMNRAFKRATGTTVMDYIINKRIIMARQMIRNGQTAADAAITSGFGDYSSFYRAYKKVIGCGPAEDKQNIG